MMIFIILAPYGTFTTLMLISSAAISMFAAAAICLMAIGYDVWRGRSVKILGAGSACLFVALGCYNALVDSGWSSSAVKLAVDIGVLTITLGSLAIRRPFTLQYAREIVSPGTTESPDFRRLNYVITWAWSVACLLMATGNILMIYVPGMPFWAGIAIATAARFAALYFTAWYRHRHHPADVRAAQVPLLLG
jgi:hypothetical protein